MAGRSPSPRSEQAQQGLGSDRTGLSLIYQLSPPAANNAGAADRAALRLDATPARGQFMLKQNPMRHTISSLNGAGIEVQSGAGTGGMYKPGDRVVYTATKHSAHPGPRAEAVAPEPHGEGYSYHVKKYWTVLEVQPGGGLKVVTRRGKHRFLPPDDPQLRPARWWETLFLRSRFPRLPAEGDARSEEEPADAPSEQR